jgi:hypothetical protein
MLLVVFLTSSFFQKQKSDIGEYTAKAAFIYNFTKFVEWNDAIETSPSFVIGVLGDSPIYYALQDIAKTKKINNKTIEVVKCISAKPENCKCHILFIPENTDSDIFKEYCKAPSLKNALVISEKQGSLDRGSAINFLIIDNRIRFEISMNTLNKCNLKASSQLLKLAVTVQN